MKRKRHTPEEIIRKLRDAEADLAAGLEIGQICQKLCVSEATFHRWRNQYGGMKAEEMKRLKELEIVHIKGLPLGFQRGQDKSHNDPNLSSVQIRLGGLLRDRCLPGLLACRGKGGGSAIDTEGCLLHAAPLLETPWHRTPRATVALDVGVYARELSMSIPSALRSTCFSGGGIGKAGAGACTRVVLGRGRKHGAHHGDHARRERTEMRAPASASDHPMLLR